MRFRIVVYTGLEPGTPAVAPDPAGADVAPPIESADAFDTRIVMMEADTMAHAVAKALRLLAETNPGRVWQVSRVEMDVPDAKDAPP